MKQDLERQIDGVREEVGSMKRDLERQIDGVKQEVVGVKQELGHRIDRMEDRMVENHREVSDRVAKDQREVSDGFAETKAAISALSAKLDERSSPRRLEGTGLASAAGPVAASGAVVRETSGSYPEDGPTGEAEEEAPEDGRHDSGEERPDQA